MPNSAEYIAGATAFAEGQLINHNPHLNETRAEHTEWARGFLTAEEAEAPELEEDEEDEEEED